MSKSETTGAQEAQMGTGGTEPTAKAFDGSFTPAWTTMPCGARAMFDGGYSYICQDCFCVLGSVGTPDQCREKCNV